MAENIRNNSNINGIKIGRNHEMKLSQLADDTTAFLKTERDVPILIQEINIMETSPYESYPRFAPYI